MSKSERKLVIVRHGETAWNAEGRLMSYTDLGLNEAGKTQASQTAEVLGDMSFDAVYASPTLRTRQTAEHILSQVHFRGDLEVDERLREVNFGPFEGEKIEELTSGSPMTDAFRAAWRNQEDPVFPDGAETYNEATKRAESIFSEIEEREEPNTLVVSHGHFSRILIAHCVLDLPARLHRRLRFDNARAAVVTWENSMPRLIAFNASSLDSD